MKAARLFYLVVGFPLLAAASDVCVGFSELTLGTVYPVGDTFNSSGVECEVERFQLSNGVWTSNGTSRVMSGDSLSAGSGPPFLWFGNANVRLGFGVATDIQLNYGAYGGNQNLRVNGALTNFYIMGLDGAVLGSVELTVLTSTNGRGQLLLNGIIEDFAIGGQEFALDDICITPFAGPKIREITVGPSNQVTLQFSYPGTNSLGLALHHIGALGDGSGWLVDTNAIIVSTSKGWFAVTTTRQTGLNQVFYRIGESTPSSPTAQPIE